MSSRAAIFRPLVSFPTTHSNVNKTKTQLKTAKISAIFCAFFVELCSPSPRTHAFVYVLLFFLDFQTFIFCFNFHFSRQDRIFLRFRYACLTSTASMTSFFRNLHFNLKFGDFGTYLSPALPVLPSGLSSDDGLWTFLISQSPDWGRIRGRVSMHLEFYTNNF